MNGLVATSTLIPSEVSCAFRSFRSCGDRLRYTTSVSLGVTLRSFFSAVELARMLIVTLSSTGMVGMPNDAYSPGA